MDTFQLCHADAERAAWSFDESVRGLEFDFQKRFLPSCICGQSLPEWLDSTARLKLNQIRGFSYAHIFLFVESLIIEQTCSSALGYVHEDNEALSALVRFTEEETKHQRMFELVKDRLVQGFGFTPGELGDKEGIARSVNEKPPFSVFLLILVLEWLTQRHYVECFKDEEVELDPGFVTVFRLHWTEEAQHARMDAVQLRRLAASMSRREIEVAAGDFVGLLRLFGSLLSEQDQLDLQSLEQVQGETFSPEQREELLACLNREWIWTFLVSGLEHAAFRSVFQAVVPEELLSFGELNKVLDWEE